MYEIYLSFVDDSLTIHSKTKPTWKEGTERDLMYTPVEGEERVMYFNFQELLYITYKKIS